MFTEPFQIHFLGWGVGNTKYFCCLLPISVFSHPLIHPSSRLFSCIISGSPNLLIIRTPFCPSICQPFCPSIYPPSVHISVHPSVHPFIHLLSIYLSIYMSALCPSICPPFFPSICQPTYFQ